MQTHAPTRHKLPRDRVTVVHEVDIAGHNVVLRCGLYPDGRLGELFIETSKSGSTLSGVFDNFATAISIALQYNVPLSVLACRYIDMRYEPCGVTSNPEIPYTTSFADYVFRYLMRRFAPDDLAELEQRLERERAARDQRGVAW